MDSALPQLVADEFTAHANGDPTSFDVLANDAFLDYAGPKQITALSYPTGGGSVEIGPDGTSVVYRPAGEFSGNESFGYVVDGQFTAQVNVQVISPLAGDEFLLFPDGLPHTFDLLSNDPFWEEYTGARRITIVSATQLGGTVSLAGDGRSVVYTAPDDPTAIGQKDHFTYIVDGKYSANVAVDLFDPLVASQRQVPQNSEPVVFRPLDVSHFDQWPAYTGAKRVTSATSSIEGSSLSIGADGLSLEYRPATDFIGSDTITFVVDGKFGSTLSVYVGPATENDYYAVDQNDPGKVLGVLGNDYYRGSSGTYVRLATQITSITQPEHGRVEIVDGGAGVRYTPAAGFVGNGTFTYRANDKYTATVSVAVSRPVRDDFFPRHNSRIVADSLDNVLDVLANDFYQPGAHSITQVGVTSEGGIVSIQSGGQAIVYTPKPGFVGREEFAYTVDGQFSARVFVDVRSPAGAIYLDFDPIQGETYRIQWEMYLPGLDKYSGNKEITNLSVHGNLTAALSPNGREVLVTPHDFSYATISYTLDHLYTGTISVSFRPSRFLGPSASVVDQNTSTPLDVLAGAPWKYHDWYQGEVHYVGARLITAVFGARHGTVSIAPDGKTVIYQPHADFVGRDTLQYMVDGHELGTATVQVIRRVRDDQFRVDAGSRDNVLRVGLNDQLGGGYAGNGQITHASAPAQGSVQIAADGRSLVYTPNAGFTGKDSVTYTVDGRLKATVEIEVAPQDQGQYPRFESLAALEAWLLQNAIEQYGSLFGNPASEIGYGDYNDFDVWGSFAATATLDTKPRHSDTNVQVEGVDEADLVETDGEFLYVLSGGKLVVSRAGGDSLEIVSETAIEGSVVGMYLSGDRLAVVSRTGMSYVDHGPWLWWRPIVGAGQTTVTVFDVASRQSPLVVQRTEIDGTHLDSRKVGDFVYLAINNHRVLALPAPHIIDEPVNVPTDPSQRSGRYEPQEEYVQRIRDQFGELLDSILPHYRSYRPDGSLVRSGLLLVPEEIGMPLDASDRSLLSMVAIDTASGEPGIVSTAGIVSSAAAELFLNHGSAYLLRPSNGLGEVQTTDILKLTFDEQTGQIAPAARGTVAGHVLDQFSLDEHDGDLRIATTVRNAWADNWSGVAENDVWVLRQDGALLELIGGLQNLAPGESIRSVRYLDERMVITTFPTAQVGIDPVYAIDLSDPTNPGVAGQLILPGFSQYMQFIDATHVLTVGVNAPTLAGQGGWGAPVQVSLFDVSDFAHPVLVDQYTLARFSTSLAQQDHHAFGWYAELGMLALPLARSYETFEDRNGDGYRETRTTVHADEVLYFRIHTDLAGVGRAIELAGTVELEAEALRTAFVGDALYAIGDGQIVASSIVDPGTPLASVAWEIPPVVGLPWIDIGPIIFPITPWPLPTIDRIPTYPRLIEFGDDLQIPTLPGDKRQLTSAMEAARADLADRLDVSPHRALLVSVESPPPGEAGATGPKIVLRVGEQHYLYQVRADGSVELVDSDFQFPSGGQAGTSGSLTPDVNRDGRVSPLDVLQVINDLILHDGLHRVGDSSLRQITSAAEVAAPDVNHDGQITALDLLLVINAMLAEPTAASFATTTDDGAGAVALSAPPAMAESEVALSMASGLTLGHFDLQELPATSSDVWQSPDVEDLDPSLPASAPHFPFAVVAARVPAVASERAFELTDDWLDLDEPPWSDEFDCPHA